MLNKVKIHKTACYNEIVEFEPKEVNYPLPEGEGASEVITPTNVGSSFRFLSLRSTDK